MALRRRSVGEKEIWGQILFLELVEVDFSLHMVFLMCRKLDSFPILSP